MDLQRKACERAEFKLSEEASGSFSGYASVFSIVDRAGEIVAPGAFTKSLEAFQSDGWIAVAHDWDALPVASIKDCRQDAKGLWVEAEFHSTPAAQATRTYVRERLQRGKSVGLSIGYFVHDSLSTKEGLLLKEIEVSEASIVTMPANPAAGAVRAKAVVGAAGLPLAPRDRAWDSGAVDKRVRRWADATDAANAKYARAFMVRDGDADLFTSYKLPFADVIDGELQAVPRALFAIAAALQGARG
jgi:HK97 family phage prohead protease